MSREERAGRACYGDVRPDCCPADSQRPAGPQDATRADAEHLYLCIDLKCFYASVECVDRGWDPFEKRMVVADLARSNKTICLAISPAMKALGVRNRCRIFEIPPGIEYEAVPPRMHRYMEMSAQIYSIYLRYISPEDIHVYSIDECFIDATPYLALYGKTVRELAVMLMDAVARETGICATAGIGTNLFLAKVALDITAKHADDHIGFLDEEDFRQEIWTHRPITDIWNIGPGIARRLEKYGVHDLFGVAFMSPDTLYCEFGINAEFLIDHAWGREPCTIAQIKQYEPQGRSICNGQVLFSDYTYDEALVVLKEMVDASVLDMVDQRVVCDSIGIMVGYAKERAVGVSGSAGVSGTGAASTRAGSSNGWPSGVGVADEADAASGASNPSDVQTFTGEHGTRPASWRQAYGYASGTRRLSERTNSYRKLMPYFEELFAEKVDRNRPIHRMSITLAGLVDEEFATVTLFDDEAADERELQLQRAVLAVKDKFGKNALVKGINMHEKSTARERNELIGGHRA